MTAAVIGIFAISYLLKFAKTSWIYVIDFVLGAVTLIIALVATVLALQVPVS